MSKKRRTKKERVIAQLRKQIRQSRISESDQAQNDHTETQNIQEVKPEEYSFQTPVKRHFVLKEEKKDYGYVLKETKKTVIITFILFLLNLLLYYIAKNHSLNINLIS